MRFDLYHDVARSSDSEMEVVLPPVETDALITTHGGYNAFEYVQACFLELRTSIPATFR